MKSNTVSSFLSKILSLLNSHFPKLFLINSFGKPREYSIGSILALMIFSARNSSFSFRKIIKLIRDDEYILTLLKFNKAPHFSVLFKTYKKYIEPKYQSLSFKKLLILLFKLI